MSIISFSSTFEKSVVYNEFTMEKNKRKDTRAEQSNKLVTLELFF